jgi:hypothetical protein
LGQQFRESAWTSKPSEQHVGGSAVKSNQVGHPSYFQEVRRFLSAKQEEFFEEVELGVGGCHEQSQECMGRICDMPVAGQKFET